MEIWLWIRFIVGTLFLLAGMIIFIIEVAGVFHLHYILNRMHMAATGDTLGIGLALIGLMFLSGFNFTTLKLAMVILLLWFSSPVSSHLIARMEVETYEGNKKYEIIDMTSSEWNTKKKTRTKSVKDIKSDKKNLKNDVLKTEMTHMTKMNRNKKEEK